VSISSTNSLQRAINTFGAPAAANPSYSLAPNGWKEWLRQDAVKIFVEVTDDQSAITAASFDSQLLALPGGHFGTAQKRNYIFHSIIGMPSKADPTQAYEPTEPKNTGTNAASKCSTAVNNGPQYQDLSILTGGLRFPVCNIANYDAVFKKIAEGVVEGSKVECDFPIPDPEIIDPATVKIEYTPSNGGPVQTYFQVPDLASCAPEKFYISNNVVHMCPATCSVVQQDNQAKVNVLYGCKIFILLGVDVLPGPGGAAAVVPDDDPDAGLPCGGVGGAPLGPLGVAEDPALVGALLAGGDPARSTLPWPGGSRFTAALSTRVRRILRLQLTDYLPCF
jgi:hypothetical protein